MVRHRGAPIKSCYCKTPQAARTPGMRHYRAVVTPSNMPDPEGYASGIFACAAVRIVAPTGSRLYRGLLICVPSGSFRNNRKSRRLPIGDTAVYQTALQGKEHPGANQREKHCHWPVTVYFYHAHVEDFC
jgi:hypothetical protein